MEALRSGVSGGESALKRGNAEGARERVAERQAPEEQWSGRRESATP
jgi:hypothetical protein